ncbi:hypothetical protein AVEN_168291-1 [Araneus ventricosus]|uniref:Uncharacterized protein n=1 Tax=Araneus ventricosus TaxID=182803 RepID=A0A4Y2GTR3_ARAVE|nr:hypothetical protein AVEN_168291-1 [Araneus ventricosus]
MTNSSNVWTPDLGDKLGDEIWDLKGAGIFSISLLAGDTLECTRRFHVTSRLAAGDYIRRTLVWRCVLIDWDRLGARTSLEFVRSAS